jgi:hypothetical protein
VLFAVYTALVLAIVGAEFIGNGLLLLAILAEAESVKLLIEDDIDEVIGRVVLTVRVMELAADESPIEIAPWEVGVLLIAVGVSEAVIRVFILPMSTLELVV